MGQNFETRKGINFGKTVAEERNIIWSWGYWYGRAIPKVSDILLDNPSPLFMEQIEASMKKVGDKAMHEMKSLE